MTTKGKHQSATTAFLQREPFISIHNVPIYFAEDWRTGIGGGLWSTGLALARYFGTDPTVSSLRRLCQHSNSKARGVSVLELGSGNGFLAVCFAALAVAQNIPIKDLVVTDTADHLDMIRETIAANPHTVKTVETATVMEHLWGIFSKDDDTDGTTCVGERTDAQAAVQNGTMKFDLILGSDVAYREALYDPLIRSIQQFSHAKTVSLIGVTMADTTPEFFDRLDKAGLDYQMLADHLLEPEYRGTTFGIFVIQPKQKRYKECCSG